MIWNIFKRNDWYGRPYVNFDHKSCTNLALLPANDSSFQKFSLQRMMLSDFQNYVQFLFFSNVQIAAHKAIALTLLPDLFEVAAFDAVFKCTACVSDCICIFQLLKYMNFSVKKVATCYFAEFCVEVVVKSLLTAGATFRFGERK